MASSSGNREVSPELSKENILSQLERIANALGKQAPAVVEIEYTSKNIRRARLEDGGRKLVLDRWWAPEEIQEELIWYFLEPDLKSHGNLFVRNPDRYDMLLVILIGIAFCVLIMAFPMMTFILRIVSLATVMTCYLLAVFSLGPRKKEYAEIVAEAMIKTDSWSRNRARKYIKRITWMGYGTGLFLSIVFGITGLVLAILFELFPIQLY